MVSECYHLFLPAILFLTLWTRAVETYILNFNSSVNAEDIELIPSPFFVVVLEIWHEARKSNFEYRHREFFFSIYHLSVIFDKVKSSTIELLKKRMMLAKCIISVLFRRTLCIKGIVVETPKRAHLIGNCKG